MEYTGHKCNDIVVKVISNLGKSNVDGPTKGDGGITKQLSEVQTQIQKLVDHVNIQLDTRLKEFESKRTTNLVMLPLTRSTSHNKLEPEDGL